jgi:agmatinase
MTSTPSWPTGLPHNFGGLEPEFSSIERARVVVLPVPYDFTTTYQGGTRWGPRAILSASQNMELWDEELGATYRAGIHTLPELEPTARGPEAMVERVEQAVDWIFAQDRIPAMLGGEHSITAGAVRAAARRVPGLSVLQLDAHADMRDVYLDTKASHACVMRRIREIVPAVSVGIRSLSEEEAGDLERSPVPMWSTRRFRSLGRDWSPILDALTDRVFVTFDLDALDPSILPATGTPEPGGLDWYEAVDLLAAVSRRARIVGFDIVELAPIPGQVASDFLAARLAYRLMGLALQSQA